MKIAILTQPLHNNYGGILQCYALQTVLEGMGHQVTVINRRWARPGMKLLAMRFASLAKCMVRKCLMGRRDIALCNPWAENYSIRKLSDSAMKRNSEMKRFINEYIHSTKPLRSSEELRNFFTSNTFDCIVVGSDQVWREIYSPCIEDFFLGFLPEDNNTLKITYAASFGTVDSPISDEHLANCIGLSGRFSAISVREQSGVEIMKNIFGHESKLVLDPTLLLTAKQYTFPLSQCPKGGLVSYILDETEKKGAVLQAVANATQLKQSKIRVMATKYDDNSAIFPSIEEWLSEFAAADFIVTDSFHGCVFSILNHKPFIAIANKDRGLERFTSLLGTFGLTDRLVFDFNEFKQKECQLLQPINYKQVECRKQELVRESKDFLEDAIHRKVL